MASVMSPEILVTLTGLVTMANLGGSTAAPMYSSTFSCRMCARLRTVASQARTCRRKMPQWTLHSYTYLRVVPGSVAVYDDLSVPPVRVDIVPYVDVMDSLHLPVWMPPVSVSTSVPPNCSSLCRILKSPRVSCTSSAVSDLCTTRDTCHM